MIFPKEVGFPPSATVSSSQIPESSPVDQTKKARMRSQPSPERSCDAGVLKPRPWYAYRDETRSSRLKLSLGRGAFTFSFDQQHSPASFERWHFPP